MVTVLPVRNRNFPGDPEEPYAVPGADEETKSHFTLIFLWNLAIIARNFPGIIVRQQHKDQKQMGLLQEQCVE